MSQNSHDVAEHVQTHTITEYEHFPEHGARTETLEFRNSKHVLESVEHLGCYVCGSMQQRESHHIFERAFWNGLDVRQVAMFLYEHFDFHGHVHRDFKSADELYEWFMQHFNGKVETVTLEHEDGTPYTVELHSCDDNAADTLYNQLILDEIHHRGMSTGIHGSTAPSFFAWLARKPGFEPTFTPTELAAHRQKVGESQ